MPFGLQTSVGSEKINTQSLDFILCIFCVAFLDQSDETFFGVGCGSGCSAVQL